LADNSVAAEPPMSPVYRLKVSLVGTRPPIWRRLQISGAMTLKQLHLAIQAVMGWQNYHLYMFRIDGLEYGQPDPELPCVNAGSVTVRQALPTQTVRCTYEYDFGDGWEHKISVEAIAPDAPVGRPVCLDGRRAGPPEDCGGVPGYERVLEALADPKDPEHDEMVKWTGGDFDPERFDVEEANRRLGSERSLKPPRPKKNRVGTRGSRTPHSNPDVEPPLPTGMTHEDMDTLSAIMAAELDARGLTPDQTTEAVLEDLMLDIHARALSLGLRALAAERRLSPAASERTDS